MAESADLKEPLSSYSVEVLHDNKKKTAFVWRHFGRLILMKDGKRKEVYSDKVLCKPCFVAACDRSANPDNIDLEVEIEETGTVILASVLFDIKAYSKTVSTSNLATHLRDGHKITEEDALQKKPGATLKNYYTVNRTPKLGDTEDHKRWLLARDLALWCCRSLMPFDMCEDVGTNDFMKKYKVIGPNELLPSRVTVSGTALRDVYDAMFAYIKKEVEKASPYGAMSLDGWSDSYRRNAYFAFIYDVITAKLEKRRFVLQTSVCHARKDHLQIVKEINGVLRRYQLEDKNITYVTDKGSNMVKAIQTMGAPHHLCLGHGVHNLVSKDGIKGALVVDELCKKARAVCKAVRYRAPVIERENKKEQGLDWLKAVVDADEHAATDDADPIPDPPDADDSTAGGAAAAAGSGGQDRNQNQTSNGDEMFLQYPIAAAPTSVKLPVPTRWHTVLIMLESLEQNKGPVNIVLSEVGKEDLHFSNAQYSTMKSMIGFLSAFRRAVEILSAESCTLNLALLLRSELEDVLKEDEEDSLVVGDLKRRLRDRLDFRFPVNDLLVTAALLDPRCANLVIVNEYLRVLGESKAEFLARQVRYNVLESHLPDEARRGREEPVEELQAQPGPSTSRNKRKSATTAEELMNLSRKHSKSQDGTRAEAVDKEVRLYLDSCNPDDVKDNDVLAFWRGRLKQYPWLSTAVRKFLCIPATSTTAERVFSIAGLTITAKRSRLNPDRVDIIIFIHENYDICSKLFQ